MKKVTYIDYKGDKITRLCYKVSHYKNYVKLDWYDEEKKGYYYEDVKYENIIEEGQKKKYEKIK